MKKRLEKDLIDELFGVQDAAFGDEPLDVQVRKLTLQVTGLHKLLLDTRRMIPAKEQIRQMILEAAGEQQVELEKVRDDAIEVLNVLIDSGAVSREALNNAVV